MLAKLNKVVVFMSEGRSCTLSLPLRVRRILRCYVGVAPRSLFGVRTGGKPDQAVSELTKAARDHQRFAADPGRIVRGEEHRGGGYVVRFSDAAERRLRFQGFAKVAFVESRGNNSFGYYHSWIDGVDADLPRPKLLRERSSYSVHCGLGRVVNDRSRWSQRAGKGAHVNDASAAGFEMLERLLRDEKHPQNVCVKHSVKPLLGYFFEWSKFVNTGVINQDIDFTERFLRFTEEPLDLCLLRDVCLDRDCGSATLCDFVHHTVRILFRRGVIDDYGCAFGREVFGDTGADSFRRTCYYGDFTSKLF